MIYMEEKRINRLFEFFREIDKEKFIQRQTYLTDAQRKENDAEHAWHMAIMTILLSEYANEKIDVLKTVTMLSLTLPVESLRLTNRKLTRGSGQRTSEMHPVRLWRRW